uniref:MADF domain-containing protein n=1 Tax=Ditylenchus dipsaci TaxID=166011 RepID=A0A915ERZ0_9BILA
MGAKSRESCSSSDDQPEATTSVTQANVTTKRSTVALYSDELRLSIIEEVFKRPILWDNSNREPASLIMRKEYYEEIAESLKSIDQTLNAAIVEKQWKNLKDTYNKVKKKKTLDENGLVVTPKWRFYNHMLKRMDKIPDNNNEYSIPNKMLRAQSQEDLSEEEYDSFWGIRQL